MRHDVFRPTFDYRDVRDSLGTDRLKRSDAEPALTTSQQPVAAIDNTVSASSLPFNQFPAFPAVIDVSNLKNFDAVALKAGTDTPQFPGDGAFIGDVNSDGFDDIAVTSSARSLFGLPNADSVFVIYGTPNTEELNGVLDTNGGLVLNNPRGGIISFVAAAGDVNNDGISDFLIGAPNAEDADGNRVGAMHVVFGQGTTTSSTIDLSTLDGSNGFTILGRFASTEGLVGAAAGDINADGITDIILGDGGADPDGVQDAGAVHVLFGRSGDFPMLIDLDGMDAATGITMEGADAEDALGTSVAGVGDVNADGFDDVLIGVPHERDVFGEALLLFGAPDFAEAVPRRASDIQPGIGAVIVAPGFVQGSFGASVSGLGDFDGDGIDDVLIANPFDGFLIEGFSFILFGDTALGSTGTIPLSHGGTSEDWIRLRGTSDVGRFGTPIVGAGDINGDGLADFLVSAPFASDPVVNSGVVHLVYGQSRDTARTIDLSEPTAVEAASFRGTNVSDLLRSTTGSGDFNGDGFSDIVLLDPEAEPDGQLIIIPGRSRLPIQPDTFENNDVVTRATPLGPVIGVNTWTDLSLDRGDQDWFIFDLEAEGSLASAVEVMFDRGFGDLRMTLYEGEGEVALAQLDTGDLSSAATPAVLTLEGLAPGTYALEIEGTDQAIHPRYDLLLSGPVPLPAPAFPETIDLGQVNGETGVRVIGTSYTGRLATSGQIIGDVNADGIDDLALGSWIFNRGSGLVSVVFGREDGIFPSQIIGERAVPDEQLIIPGIATEDRLGTYLTGVGDMNGDGTDDFALAAPSTFFGQDRGAKTYVIFGREGLEMEGSLDLNTLDGLTGFVLRDNRIFDTSVMTMDGAGDVNGDGFDDLIVGASLADVADELNAGQVFIVFGGPGHLDRDFLDLENLSAEDGVVISGAIAGDLLGTDVRSAGDVDRDGIDDVLIGAPQVDAPDQVNNGAAYLVYGSSALRGIGEVSLADPQGVDIARILGTEGSLAGQSLVGVNDFNRDGFDDIAISAPLEAVNGITRGTVSVLYGGSQRLTGDISLSSLAASDGFHIHGQAETHSIGSDIGGGNDVNGDGIPDLIVSSFGTDPETGRTTTSAKVIYGGPSVGLAGAIDIVDLGPDEGVTLTNSKGETFALLEGNFLDNSGDLNGDGVSDVVLNYASSSPGRVAAAGESIVLFGRNAIASPAVPAADFVLDAVDFDTNNALNGDVSFVPAAPSGAANTDFLVNAVNGAIEWYTAEGEIVASQSLQDFFAPVAFDAGRPESIFSPQVIYDSFADRFLVIASGLSGLTTSETQDDRSQIYFAVSNTADPSEGWTFHREESLDFIAGASTWASDPRVAVTDQAVIVTANMRRFEAEGTLVDSRTWLLDKGLGTGGLYDGGAPLLVLRTDPNPFQTQFYLRPAQVLDTDPNPPIVLIENDIVPAGAEDFIEVLLPENPLTGPVGGQSFRISLGDIGDPVSGFLIDGPDSAPQAGSPVRIDTGTDQAIEGIVRNDVLTAVFPVLSSAGPDAGQTSVHWVQIDLSGSAPTLLRQGHIGGEELAPGTFTSYPSVSVTESGLIGIGFNASAPALFAGQYFAEIPATGGGAAQLTQIRAGQGPYVRTFGDERNRLGSASATQTDPKDPEAFWTFGAFAAAPDPALTQDDGRWGTAWGRIETAEAGEPGNRAPFFQSAASASVPENRTETGYQASALDPDGDPITYAVTGGADADAFTLDPLDGTLRFRAAPDFEMPSDADQDNIYQVDITASDGALSSTLSLSLTVINVNEEGGSSGLNVVLANDTGISASDSITNDPTVIGSVGDPAGVSRLEARLDDGPLLDISTEIGSDGAFILDGSDLDRINGSTLSDGLQTLELQAVRGEDLELARVTFLLDRTAPEILDGPATTFNVSPDQLDIVFSEALSADRLTPDLFRVRDASGSEVVITSVDQSDASQAQLNFNQPLGNGTYTLEVFSAQLEDLAGNRLIQPPAFSFVVDAATRVTASGPADGAGLQTLNRKVTIEFDRPIDPITVDAQSFQVLAGGRPLPGRIAVSSNEQLITFFPETLLPASTEVLIRLDGDRVQGRDGRAIDGDGDGVAGGLYTASFSTVALTRVADTNVVGFVFDSNNRGSDGEDLPLEGVRVSVIGLPGVETTTDADGRFFLEDLPIPDAYLHFDASAVTAETGFQYGTIDKPVHTKAGQTVTMTTPDGSPFNIYFAAIPAGDAVPLVAGQPTEATLGTFGLNNLVESFPDVDPAEWEKLKVTVPADSLTFDDGRLAESVTVMAFEPDRIPAPVPEGFDPEIVFTVTGNGATNVDGKAQVEFPNLDNLAPGEKRPILSFDHDAGQWVQTGTAIVSADGSTLVSEGDTGVNTLGWKFLGDDLISILTGAPSSSGAINAFTASLNAALTIASLFPVIGTPAAVISALRNVAQSCLVQDDEAGCYTSLITGAGTVALSLTGVKVLADFGRFGKIKNISALADASLSGSQKALLGGIGVLGGSVELFSDVDQGLRKQEVAAAAERAAQQRGLSEEAVTLYRSDAERQYDELVEAARNAVRTMPEAARQIDTFNDISNGLEPIVIELEQRGVNVEFGPIDEERLIREIDDILRDGASDPSRMPSEIRGTDFPFGDEASSAIAIALATEGVSRREDGLVVTSVVGGSIQDAVDADISVNEGIQYDGVLRGELDAHFVRIDATDGGFISLDLDMVDGNISFAFTIFDEMGNIVRSETSELGYSYRINDIPLPGPGSYFLAIHSALNPDVNPFASNNISDFSGIETHYEVTVELRAEQKSSVLRLEEGIEDLVTRPDALSEQGENSFLASVKEFEDLETDFRALAQLVKEPAASPVFYRMEDVISGFTISGKINSPDQLTDLPANTLLTLSLFDPQTTQVAEVQIETLRDVNIVELSDFYLSEDVSADADGDGLSDFAEGVVGTDVNEADTDGDGILDGAEINQGLNALDGVAFPSGLIGGVALPGYAEDLVIEGSLDDASQLTAFVATGVHGLAIVDVSSFQMPIIQGQINLPGENTSVAVDPVRDLAFVAGGTAGVHIVDVSDPMAPVLRESLTDLGAVTRVLAIGGAVLAGGSDLSLMNVASGEVIQSVDLGGRITDFAVDGRTIFVVADNERLLSLDFDGNTFTVLDSVEIPIPPVRRVAPEDMRLFIENGVAYVSNGLEIQNVSNSRPLERGGHVTFDVSDPTTLSLISNIDTGDNKAGNLQTVLNGSGLALVASGFLGLELHQAEDPSVTYDIVTRFATPGSAQAVEVANGIAFVADGESGLQVINYRPFDNQSVAPTVTIDLAASDTDPVRPGIQLTEGVTARPSVRIGDDVQVRNAELLINGIAVRNDVSAPFDFTFPVPFLDGGATSGTVQVRATDTGGNIGLSELVTYEVTPDVVAPTIQSVNLEPEAVILSGPRTVTVVFSEPMAASSLAAIDVRALPLDGGAPARADDLALITDDRAALFTFIDLPSDDYELTIDLTGATDRAGNAIGGDVLVQGLSVVDEPTITPQLALNGEFGVTFSPAPVLDTAAVSYVLQDGTALTRSDYRPDAGQLVGGIGDAESVDNIFIESDRIDEPDEAVFVSFFNPVNGTFATDDPIVRTVSWSLDDDGEDRGPSLFTVGSIRPEGTGGNQNADFDIYLSRPLDVPLTVRFRTEDRSAIAGEDYQSTNGSVVFAPGETIQTVSVPIITDARPEPRQDIALIIETDGVVDAVTSGLASLLDDDAGEGAEPVATVSNARIIPGRFTTSREEIEVFVTLDRAVDVPLSLDYRVVPGTASNQNNLRGDDFDFDFEQGTLTFEPGQSSYRLIATGVGDNQDLDEVDEFIRIEFDDPLGGSLEGDALQVEAIGWILDEFGTADENRALAVTTAMPVEGDRGQHTAFFTVSLSRPATEDITISYRTIDGSAKADEDYRLAAGTLTFAAGETTAVVGVDLIPDTLVEGNERFTLAIDPHPLVNVVTAGMAEIIDDDVALGSGPVVSARGGAVPEDNRGAISNDRPLTFEVVLSEPALTQVDIDYRLLPGTALKTTDYSSALDGTRGTISFAPGQQTASITIESEGDENSAEIDETVVIELFNPDGATLAVDGPIFSSLGWLLDDNQSAVRRSVAIADPLPLEGDADRSVNLDVFLSRPAETDITVPLFTIDGSAKAGEDYEAFAGLVTFLAGQTVASVSIELLGDTVPEGTESFSLAFGSHPDVAASPAGNIRILDDDPVTDQSPVLSVLGSRAAERFSVVGTVTGESEFVLVLSEPAPRDVVVAYETRDGTATSADDYIAQSDIATIAAGETSTSIVVNHRRTFGTPEIDEAYVVELVSIEGADFVEGAAALRAPGWILEGGDELRALFVSAPVIREPEAGQRLASFEISLSRPATEDISVSYETQDITAQAGQDYRAVSGVVNFRAGQTIASVDVAILADGLDEGEETFALAIGPHPSLAASHTGVAQLLDFEQSSQSTNGVEVSDTPFVVPAGMPYTEDRDMFVFSDGQVLLPDWVSAENATFTQNGSAIWGTPVPEVPSLWMADIFEPGIDPEAIEFILAELVSSAIL